MLVLCRKNREQFLFSSPQRTLKTRGVFQTITQPASDGADKEGLFQQAVRSALEQARQAGLKAPIVVGAIPFDAREPSSLYIPQTYDFSRPTANPGTTARVSNLSPEVLQVSSVPSEAQFKTGVKQVLDAFLQTDIKKAVLSRIIDLRLAEPASVEEILANLQARNPTGYRYRVPLADNTDLIGVSPELLVEKNGSQVYSNPLAGSAKRQAESEQDRVVAKALLHSGKDGYEHRLVTDDIRRLLGPHCSQLHVPEQPSLLSTTTMWHLSTAISGVLNDPATTALQLACELHPTPAVCGHPTRQARDLIHRVESFERGVFAGTVGWCNAGGDGEWAVTIRCATVQSTLIRLFAGAGIVRGSCPDAEWAEIRAKLGTMLAALGCDSDTVLSMNMQSPLRHAAVSA